MTRTRKPDPVRKSIALFLLFLFVSSQVLLANPSGGTVVSGHAGINQTSSSVLTINQTSPRVIINWKDFSIGAGETTKFLQPSGNAAALNEVITANPSLLYGSLQANGQVYLINQNGIVVGPKGEIDTRGFVASTLNVANNSFMAGGSLKFVGNSTAAVLNMGTISALGGDVFLIGANVGNNGTIRASQGTVGLAAGSEVQLVQAGNEKLSVLAGNPNASGTGVDNKGNIEAVAAELKAADGNIYALAINNEGVVRATTVVRDGGRIYLRAVGGTVVNSGTLDASGAGAGSKGGEVQVLGANVSLTGSAVVNVSGDAGGGTALIGGDLHGANSDIPNAQQTTVDEGAKVFADALSSGNGGEVVVWSDNTTVFSGNIYARALGTSGNGGFAEISGKQNLLLTGHADLRSVNGKDGTLLLDPGSVYIVNSNDATLAIDTVSDSYISNQLTTSSLTISTAANGTNGTGDLVVSNGANIFWNNNNVLTLNGSNSITLMGGSFITNTAHGNLSLVSTAGIITQAATIFLAGGNATITAGVSVVFQKLTSIGSNLTVSAGGVITQTVLGVITTGGTASFNAGTNSIALTRPGNDFGGAVTVNNTGTNNVALSTSAALTIGGSVGSNLTVVAGGDVTNTSLTIGGTLAETAHGNIVQSGALTMTVSNGASTFTVSGTTGSVLLGNSNDFGAQTVTITNDLTGTLQDVDFRNINVAANFTNLNLGTLAGNLTVQFDNAGVGLTALNLHSNLTVIAGGGAITNASLIVGSNLTETAIGGIVQTGSVTVTGTSSFTAGSAITLTSNNNDFVGAVTVNTPSNVTLSNSTDLIIGGTVGGNLTVGASGAITQVVSLVVTGASSFNAGTGITLATATNQFIGAVTVTNTVGNNVALYDATNLTIGGSVGSNLTVSVVGNLTNMSLTVASNLTETATGGAISQTGSMTVGGTSSLTAGTAITLATNNDFIGAVTVNAASNVTLSNSTALTIGGAVGGNLTVGASGNLINTNLTVASNLAETATGGAISQTASMTVTGASSFTAGTGITLTTTNNQFIGAVTVTNAANSIALYDATNLTIGGSVGSNLTASTGGNLIDSTLTATSNLAELANGSIIETGAITNSGTAIFRAGAAITLTNLANDFIGAVTVSNSGPNNVVLSNSTALAIAGTVGNNLTVGAAGPLTQVGALLVGGITTVNVGTTNNITLNNGNNSLATVAITAVQNVTLVDTNAIVLGASTVSGTLSVTAQGNITQNGALAVASGASTFSISNATGSVLLSQLNNFGGQVVTITNTSGGVLQDVYFRNTNSAAVFSSLNLTSPAGNLTVQFDNAGIVLPTLNLNSNLTAIAGGSITQSGALTVHNTATLSASGSIALTNFTGTIAVTSAVDVALTSATVSLGLITNVLGNLTVTSTSSDITQNAGIDVGNSATLNTAQNLYLASNITASSLWFATTNTHALAYITSGTDNWNVAGTLGWPTGAGLITLTNAAGGFHTVNATVGTEANSGSVKVDTTSVIFNLQASGFLNATLYDAILTNSLTYSGTTTVYGVTTLFTNNTDVFSGAVVLYPATNSAPVFMITNGGTAVFNATLDSGTNGPYDVMFTLGGNGTVYLNGAVGGSAPFGNLSTSGSNSASAHLGAPITTVGNQTYGSRTFVSNNISVVSLTSSNGGVFFNNTVDGPGSLGITVGNTTNVLFAAPVGASNALGSLTVTAGTIDLNGTNVTTIGAQTYNGAVVLTADATLTSAGGNVAFSNTVDGAYNLTVSATNGVNFYGGAVGSGTNLVSLTATATLIDLNGTNVTTMGAQAYNGAVVLTTNTVLTSAGGNVAFSNTLDGAYDLTVSATNGSAIYGGAVGSGTNLTLLTTTAGSIDLNGTNVTTMGAQAYNGPVVLTTNTVLTSTGGSNIAFASTVDADFVASNRTLTVTTVDGTTIYDGAIGSNAPLGSLTVTAANIDLNGTNVTTTGSQTYNGAVALGTATVIDATNSFVQFFGTVDSAANTPEDLTVNVQSGQSIFEGTINASGLVLSDGTVLFSQAIGSQHMIGTLTVNGFGGGGGAIDLNGGTVTTIGAQTYNGAVVLTTNTVLTSTGGSSITFFSTVDADFTASNRTLTVTTAGGTTIYDGAVGSNAPLGSLTVTAANIDLNGTNVITSGSQAYNGAVVLGSDMIVSSAVGNVSFAGTVDGAHNLTVSTIGTNLYGGAVGSGANLVSLTATASLIDLNATNVTTAGAQTYNGAVALGANTTLTSTNGGTVTVNGTVNGEGNNLTVNTTGTTTFGNAITNVNALMTDVGGTTVVSGTVSAVSVALNDAAVLAGGTVTTTGSQLYSNTVTLGANTTLGSTGAGAITVNGAVNGGGSNLTVSTSGATAFGNAITNVNALTTDAGGTTIVSGTVNAASVALNDAVALDGGTVTTTGSQLYGNTVTLGTNTTLASGGNIAFNNTVDGAHSLTVNAAGPAIYDGAVGNGTKLASLSTTAGAIDLNGGTVATAGAQTYSGAVALGANTTLGSTGGGAITVNGVVNGGGNNLTVNTSGTTTFGNAITSVNALTTDAGGTTVVSGTVSAASVALNDAAALDGGTVTTTGSQLYGNAVTLGANTTLTSSGGNIAFSNTVDGAHSLTVNAAGTAIYDGALGSSTNLTSLSTTAGSIDLNATTVTTTGPQTYNGAVLLGANTTLTSANGGAIAFSNTVDGAHSLTVSTTGTNVYDGAVGASNALTSLTVTTGVADLNGTNVTTIGAQTYHGAVVLGTNTTLSSTGGGNIAFSNTVDGVHSLTVSTTGTNVYGGAVGASNALASLAANAGVIDLNGGTMTTTGPQTYNGAVLLGANTTLTSANGGAIAFSNTVDGAHSLTVSTTGNNIYGGAIGSNNALLGLGVNAASVSFGSASNQVGTLAAKITGLSSGFSFTNNEALTVGTVGGVTGITTSNGDVTLTANLINIGALITAGVTNRVALQPLTVEEMTLGEKDTNTFSFTANELQLIKGGELQLGSTNNTSGVQIVSNLVITNVGTLTLGSQGIIIENNPAATIDVANLVINTRGTEITLLAVPNQIGHLFINNFNAGVTTLNWQNVPGLGATVSNPSRFLLEVNNVSVLGLVADDTADLSYLVAIPLHIPDENVSTPEATIGCPRMAGEPDCLSSFEVHVEQTTNQVDLKVGSPLNDTAMKWTHPEVAQ